jgi:hypothetical protein
MRLLEKGGMECMNLEIVLFSPVDFRRAATPGAGGGDDFARFARLSIALQKRLSVAWMPR